MLNACTIVAANYLPYARVLAESVFAHHPDASFVLLLIDDEDRTAVIDDPRIDIRRLADLGLDHRELHRLAGIYDVTELATAVKPLLLRRLLDEGRSSVVYLDPDIRVYAPINEVTRLADAHGIVLTPHTMRPYPQDDRQIDGYFILAAGVYNLGFVAVGQTAMAFLEWWWQVTRREALSDVSRNMFTDQRWIDFVPSFFDHVILKDPGYNVAYWNLHGRTLALAGDEYRVDDGPLRFFHFSGYDAARPERLSSHQGDRPRIQLGDRPVLAGLCDAYGKALEHAGLVIGARRDYGWHRASCGIEMTSRIRRLYRDGVVAAERGTGAEPPDPFDAQNPDAFLDWLKQPASDGPTQTSRYLASIYRDRLDLQIQFPDIRGQDHARFHEWVWRDSDLKETIPLELLPVEGKGGAPVTSSLDGERLASDSAIEPVEQMLPHLEAMAELQDGSQGPLGGLRRAAQRTLFRVLRPYAFQQRQLQLQLIGALRQVTVALRRQQQLHDSLDRRVRELTKELVETRRANRSSRE